jgi:hypothetical protein
LIRRNPEPLGSFDVPTPHHIPLPMFDEMQGEERDRAAESDMTVAKPLYSPKLSASERMKHLRSTISNPRGSPKPEQSRLSFGSSTKSQYPDLALLSDAMCRHGVHDEAVDALFTFSDGEGSMLLDSK